MTDILITSSALILALLALRQIFRKTLSRRLQYALWALVLVRLLVPISLPATNFSVLSAARPVRQQLQQLNGQAFYFDPLGQVPRSELEQQGIDPDSIPTLQDGGVLVESEGPGKPWDGFLVRDPETNTVTRYAHMKVGWTLLHEDLALVWKGGMAVMAGFFLVSNLGFYFRLKKNRKEWQAENGLPHADIASARKVYLVPEGVLPSPCLFLNAIYLTPAALRSEESLGHVLLHEETHARHWDPLWSLLRCVCLTVYWFDPLVWAAAVCSRTDCELACDEAVLEKLGEAERIGYGQTLLSLIPVKRAANPLLTATTMTAGKRQLKDRITRIAQKPRQLAAAVAAVVLLAAAISACAFAGGEAAPAPDPSPTPMESPEPSVTDHVVVGADAGVPAQVVTAVKACTEKIYKASQTPTVPEPEGEAYALGYPAVWDDWRVVSFDGPYYYTFGDMTVEGWMFLSELHTTTPEEVTPAGGNDLTEDNWFPASESRNAVFFQKGADGTLTFLRDDRVEGSMDSPMGIPHSIAEKIAAQKAGISMEHVDALIDRGYIPEEIGELTPAQVDAILTKDLNAAEKAAYYRYRANAGAADPSGDIWLWGTETPLTEEELRWFNEEFFNGTAVGEEYGYNIRNQFINYALNLYDRPEDIDLYQLLYLEGTPPSDQELSIVWEGSWDDIPCPAYKLTTAEINDILMEHTGLTLAEMNRESLTYTYDGQTDAYYWMHGDTNYCGDIEIYSGTREGDIVRLYHHGWSGGDKWYEITLHAVSEEEWHAGSPRPTYWFVSNRELQPSHS